MNSRSSKVEITSSKSKLLFILLLSLAFVGLGLVFVTHWGFKHHDLLIDIVGYVTIFFFGFGVFVALYRLFQRGPRLILTRDLLIYDPQNPQECAISWKEIVSLSVVEIHKQRLLMIHVADPEAFIQKNQKALHRKLMLFNLENYGAPIGLTTSDLNIKFDELYSLLAARIDNGLPSEL